MSWASPCAIYGLLRVTRYLRWCDRHKRAPAGALAISGGAVRVAVFVDSGYLYAQGSAAISGSSQKRSGVSIDAKEVISALKRLALEKADGAKLLRIYWYDGALGGQRPTAEQALLAELDDVKLRLGFVNSNGQQKGVDSLIVTDMIELARLQSISDAVLVSGDEDVRIGVQIAQNFGIRVHLVGIFPSRGSQSIQLIHEADTTTELNQNDVSRFMTIRAPVQLAAGQSPQPPASANSSSEYHLALLKDIVVKFVEALEKSELVNIEAYWRTERGVPSEHDKKLLPMCREMLGQDLDSGQKKFLRSQFQILVRRRLTKEAE